MLKKIRKDQLIGILVAAVVVSFLDDLQKHAFWALPLLVSIMAISVYRGLSNNKKNNQVN